MNISIPSYAIGAILFLAGQTTAAIWWASSLSAEVERIASVQGKAIPELQAEAQQCAIEIHNLKKLTSDHDRMNETIKGLDVLRYQVTAIQKQLDSIVEKNRDIENQHGRLFDALRNQGSSGPMQKSYSYE